MITRNLKLLSVAVAAAALIATVAIAHTLRSHATMAAAHASTGKVINTAPGEITPSQRRDFFACPMASESACEKIDLPM